MPNARRSKGILRLQVEIEHGRMGVLATGVGEMDANMRLKGALVVREPGVAIYPEERPPRRAGVGDEMRVELVQMRPEAADEQQCGVANDLLISLLVLGKPVPVVVALELAQEIEQLGAEERGVGHWRNLQLLALSFGPPGKDGRPWRAAKGELKILSLKKVRSQPGTRARLLEGDDFGTHFRDFLDGFLIMDFRAISRFWPGDSFRVHSYRNVRGTSWFAPNSR